MSYEDLLPKNLCHDVLMCRLGEDYTSTTHILPPRTGQCPDIDSVIITKKQAKWISSKIVESKRLFQENQKTFMKHDAYKFTLLYRRNRDGDLHAKFREICNNKGPTISVGKVSGTEEILGGYNPCAWGAHNGWSYTRESFIFSLSKLKCSDENIVSFFADTDKRAVYDCATHFSHFGYGGDLSFGNSTISLKGKGWAGKNSYQIPVRHLQGKDTFDWVDWEVFLISRV